MVAALFHLCIGDTRNEPHHVVLVSALTGSAAVLLAPYDSDPCGCSDEDNDAIGTRQLDQLESRKSASEWRLHYASGFDQTHIDPDDE